MMSLISQASRQQFVQQNFLACIRSQVISPSLMPRVVVRDQSSLRQFMRPDAKSLDQLKEKIKEEKINPIKVYEARNMSPTTIVNRPSKYI